MLCPVVRNHNIWKTIPVKITRRDAVQTRSDRKLVHSRGRRSLADCTALNQRHLLGSLHSHARLFGFSLLAVFIASLRRSPSVLRPTSKTGCQVPTMVLSEARGLLLFRVIREGLGSAVRLGARGTQRLTSRWRLALEPERLKNPTDHRPENFQGMGRTRETLKLFVVSDVGRRTRLLSSKRSK